ncbi:hypothetical protein V8F20_006566 [Naviculisporaceae sp. PSN 640]
MPRQPNPQNRLACDRCHGQKLRCPRQEGQGACQRCLRANATCVFSPRQKRTSPSVNKEKQRPQPPSALQAQSPLPEQQSDTLDLDLLDPDIFFVSGHTDGSATNSLTAPEFPDEFRDTGCADSNAVPTDWSTFLGLASPGPSPWEYSPQSGQSPSAQFRTTPFLETGDQDPSNTDSSSSAAADTPSSSSTTDSVDSGDRGRPNISNTITVSLHSHIRQLADLAVKLYDQYNSLPPVCDDFTDKITMGTLEGSKLSNQLIAIDEIFKMTQSLIDIMIDFYPPDSKPSKVTPDQGALLLLLSCTDRVLDIFELLFAHMHACLANKALPTRPDGKPWALPELRIGSYTPPAPTAIAMHMLTIILMASHLFDQLQEVLGVGRHGLAAGAAIGMRSKFPNFTEEAKLAVTRRARSVATDIVKARGLLLSLPGMYGSGSFGTFAGTTVAQN